MTSVDYSNYLDQQSQWATSLCRVAQHDEADRARELGEIAAETLRRMLKYCALSPHERSDHDVPWGVLPEKRQSLG